MSEDWFLQFLFYFGYLLMTIIALWGFWQLTNVVVYRAFGERHPGEVSKKSYSLKWVPKYLVVSFLIISIVSILIYKTTGSSDVTISMFAFLAAFNLGGVLRQVQLEHHFNRRHKTKDC